MGFIIGIGVGFIGGIAMLTLIAHFGAGIGVGLWVELVKRLGIRFCVFVSKRPFRSFSQLGATELTGE